MQSLPKPDGSTTGSPRRRRGLPRLPAFGRHGQRTEECAPVAAEGDVLFGLREPRDVDLVEGGPVDLVVRAQNALALPVLTVRFEAKVTHSVPTDDTAILAFHAKVESYEQDRGRTLPDHERVGGPVRSPS
jgi:hypothetical protein